MKNQSAATYNGRIKENIKDKKRSEAREAEERDRDQREYYRVIYSRDFPYR